MEYITYTSDDWNALAAAVTSGDAEPGDLLWMWDLSVGPLDGDGLSSQLSDNHHIAIYVGNYFEGSKLSGSQSSPWWQANPDKLTDRIWHSGAANTAPVQPGNAVTWTEGKAKSGPYAITLLKWKDATPLGRIHVSKTSGNTNITDGNKHYSLEGAIYSVYSDSACTNKLFDMPPTDAWGKTKSDLINFGNYWVMETKPSPGYALDTTKHPVTVSVSES